MALTGKKIVRMGLGDAVKKANNLQIIISAGIAEDVHRKQYQLIMNALNEIQIDVGFDCDGDGIPDDVEIFQRTAETDCCRLVAVDTSKRAVNTASTSRRKAKTSSRRK